MSQIIVNHAPTDLDPEVAAAVRPILAKWETAVLRVAAAETNPRLLPQAPSSTSPEGILLKRFRSLPAGARRVSAQRAATRLGSPILHKRLNPFVELKALESANSVDDLAKRLPQVRKLTKARVAELSKEHYGSLGVPAGGPGGKFAFRSLRLDLFRLVCVDETNGIWPFTETGEDEIKLSGVAFDETGDIGKLAVVDCGDFDDGTRRDFDPTRRLFTFNLGEGTTYPKSYFVTFLLVEVDQGNLSETVNAIIERLEKEAAERLTELISAETGVPPWLVAIVVNWIVDKIFDKIIAIWEDDPFTPRTVEVVLPDAGATFEDGGTFSSRVVRFGGPGEYAMRYHWTLSRTAGGS